MLLACAVRVVAQDFTYIDWDILKADSFPVRYEEVIPLEEDYSGYRYEVRLDYPEYQIEHHESRILQSIEYPFMQASLDGELTDQSGRRGILEIKTTNILRSMQYEKWKDRIPDNYYIQVLHYLLVTGYDFVVLRAHLVSEWGKDKRTTVKHYFIEREEVLDDLVVLLQEEKKFWEYVESGRKPPLILPEI